MRRQNPRALRCCSQLRPRHAILRTQGITWGTLQASLLMLFCLWFELKLALPCNAFPLILFPEPQWFTSVLRGAGELGDSRTRLKQLGSSSSSREEVLRNRNLGPVNLEDVCNYTPQDIIRDFP